MFKKSYAMHHGKNNTKKTVFSARKYRSTSSCADIEMLQYKDFTMLQGTKYFTFEACVATYPLCKKVNMV